MAYILFFNVGLMGFIAFISHTFFANFTAEKIGWEGGNPFQYEIAAANLSLGVLGVLAFWLRGSFWIATVLGSSIFLLGAFVVHIIQFSKGNTAPFNIGILIWANDLILPILMLSLLIYVVSKNPIRYK